ncbi:MAG: arginine--tRNA ligase [Candidatus Paceibacterota bacterium]
MKEQLVKTLQAVAEKFGIEADKISLEYPDDISHGDFSTNIAMAAAKALKISPKALAEKIVAEFSQNKPEFVESVSVAGPGFINFKVKDEVLTKAAIDRPEALYLRKARSPKVKQVMVEYTDPNPFKVFHIGHLMSNAIGESVSRLIEYSGAEVIRACYQGDVGLHVAKTIWALIHEAGALEKLSASGLVTDKVKLLGEMYVIGASHDDDPAIQKEIADVNKKIFDKSDPKINDIYKQGRQYSLDYFDTIYARLDTKFDRFFFESEVADDGIKTVKEFLKKGIFEESDGAIVFKGENHGLHTRVFITSNSLPTYETKELGLNADKFKQYPDLSESVIVTANEINEYFKVLLKVMSLTDPAVAEKTKHLSHGIMRFASGKMSSRKGNVISAESLIDDIKEMVKEKMVGREFKDIEVDEVSDQVAIAAIKYTILRQAIGGDVIFDSAASISFEGDSGPYLQYSAVRAQSVLNKAGEAPTGTMKHPEQAGLLERLIVRFPDIVGRARAEYTPQHIAGYLINLAGAFNAFYANSVIVDAKEPLSPYRIALTRAFLAAMTDGLWLLGIKVPKRM